MSLGLLVKRSYSKLEGDCELCATDEFIESGSELETH